MDARIAAFRGVEQQGNEETADLYIVLTFPLTSAVFE